MKPLTPRRGRLLKIELCKVKGHGSESLIFEGSFLAFCTQFLVRIFYEKEALKQNVTYIKTRELPRRLDLREVYDVKFAHKVNVM